MLRHQFVAFLTKVASHFVSHHFEPDSRCRVRDFPRHDDGCFNNDNQFYTNQIFTGREKYIYWMKETLKFLIHMFCKTVQRSINFIPIVVSKKKFYISFKTRLDGHGDTRPICTIICNDCKYISRPQNLFSNFKKGILSPTDGQMVTCSVGIHPLFFPKFKTKSHGRRLIACCRYLSGTFFSIFFSNQKQKGNIANSRLVCAWWQPRVT